ncbi:metalloregulator ArsR/SmtB family transcription factor [Oceanobacter sp. 5_MG-2023]|uniref:metalloregulator ArsR/SmtB family transcription factor n=1 Tax=unclassified Oceanobacter TaxID=2620260 RepID=UPI0034C64E65
MKVLFICTGNSARSQLAEVVLRNMAGDHFEVFSAGTQPEGIDSRTLQTLDKAGLPTVGLRSKNLTEFAAQSFDYVITLCDKAHQECRQWPTAGVTMAWDFPDPKASDDPLAFTRTLQEISERIRLFVLVNSKVSKPDPSFTPVEFFKAMADDTRLQSLLLIADRGELCVCELMTALNESQPKISRHLAQLRKNNILKDRRQGQWVYYQLHPLMPSWARDVLHITFANNTDYLAEALQRLSADATTTGDA